MSEYAADRERFHRHSSKRSKRRLGSRYEDGTSNFYQSSIHWKQAEASCVKVGNFPSKEPNQESLNMNSSQPKHTIKPLKNEDSKSDESAENNKRHPQEPSREAPLRVRTDTHQASPPDSIYSSLSDSRREIRILTLLIDKVNRPIEFKLEHMSL
jgi:hypothetical protein